VLENRSQEYVHVKRFVPHMASSSSQHFRCTEKSKNSSLKLVKVLVSNYLKSKLLTESVDKKVVKLLVTTFFS